MPFSHYISLYGAVSGRDTVGSKGGQVRVKVRVGLGCNNNLTIVAALHTAVSTEQCCKEKRSTVSHIWTWSDAHVVLVSHCC